jgi:hypothetical protein
MNGSGRSEADVEHLSKYLMHGPMTGSLNILSGDCSGHNDSPPHIVMANLNPSDYPRGLVQGRIIITMKK